MSQQGHDHAPMPPKPGTGLVFDAEFVRHDPGTEHPECPDRYRAIKRALDQSGLMARLSRIPARRATEDEVHLCHTRAYLAAVRHDIGRRSPALSTGDTGLCEHSLDVAMLAVGAALSAVDAVMTGREKNAFAAVRPPGHHATASRGMGFCIFNNAAVAARYARQVHDVDRVLIIDWDVHHGNGTQDIFYERGDVLFCSLHGNPEDCYPHFLGYRDEVGRGKGEGFNVNYPMGPGTGFDKWGKALKAALAKIKAYGPDAVVVSLGVDAYKDDPISFFKLTSEDFMRTGAAIAKLKKPTLFVMEGGYAIEAIGVNTVNVLEGFADA